MLRDVLDMTPGVVASRMRRAHYLHGVMERAIMGAAIVVVRRGGRMRLAG